MRHVGYSEEEDRGARMTFGIGYLIEGADWKTDIPVNRWKLVKQGDVRPFLQSNGVTRMSREDMYAKATYHPFLTTWGILSLGLLGGIPKEIKVRYELYEGFQYNGIEYDTEREALNAKAKAEQKKKEAEAEQKKQEAIEKARKQEEAERERQEQVRIAAEAKRAEEDKARIEMEEKIRNICSEFDHVIKQNLDDVSYSQLKKVSDHLENLLDKDKLNEPDIVNRLLASKARIARHELLQKLNESRNSELYNAIMNVLDIEDEILKELDINDPNIENIKKNLEQLEQEMESLENIQEEKERVQLENIAQRAISVNQRTENLVKERLAHQTERQIGGLSLLTRKYLFANAFESYFIDGMDQMLTLRVDSIVSKSEIKLLPSQAVRIDTQMQDLSEIAKNFINHALVHDISVLPLLIPGVNGYGHWVGIIAKRTHETLQVIYFDSENSQPINGLEKQLVLFAAPIAFMFAQMFVEQQRYNNCGFEFIENVILYLSGSRLTQEAAVPAHSLLFENSLLDSSAYAVKLAENRKIIKFLSNGESINRPIGFNAPTIPVLMPSLDSAQILLGSSLEGTRALSSIITNIDKTPINQSPSISASLLEQLMQQKYIQHLCKNLLYKDDFVKFDNIIKAFNIKTSQGDYVSRDILGDQANFKKLVLFKLHPDKGGCKEDFTFVQDLQNKFNNDVEFEELFNWGVANLQSALYKTTLGFKVVDVAVDSGRALYNSTPANLQKMATDCVHLYGMYSGNNYYSIIVAGAETTYHLYQGEYMQALQHSVMTLSYMSLPWVIYASNMPYFGLVYAASITAYSGYHTVANLYSFYLELNNYTNEGKEFPLFFSDNNFNQILGMQNENPEIG